MAIVSPIVCLTHNSKWCQFECILMLIQAHILNCKIINRGCIVLLPPVFEGKALQGLRTTWKSKCIEYIHGLCAYYYVYTQ